MKTGRVINVDKEGAMKKRLLTAVFVIMLFWTFLLPTVKIRAEGNTEQTDYFIPTSYSNQLYNCVPEVFGTCRTSFLGTLSDGGYQTVVYSGGKLYIEFLDCNYQMRDSRVVDLELPLWGGVYLGETFNYVVCGQSYHSEASNGGEVYCIIKYDKNFERIGSISLNGDETYTASPFYGGNVSIDESGNMLIVYTSRLRLDGHQSNIAIRINTDDMTVSDSYGMISFPDVHVSHSFRQIVKYDNGTLVYADVSDAYPERSFYIQSEGIAESIMAIDGQSGNNVTNAELSGLAVSDTHYLVVGSYLFFKQNNIFLSCIDKNSGEVKNQWLTNSTFCKPQYVHNPRITRISEDRFVVMWGSNNAEGYATKYILIDGKGNAVSELKECSMLTTDCEPVYVDGKILWISAEDGVLKINEITDFSENGSYQVNLEWTLAADAWDGTTDTSWYDSSRMEFNLSTAQQLAGLAQLVNAGNTFEGKKINLCNDIFMNDESYQYEWTPIACSDDITFQGTFNGNGKTIYNLKTAASAKGGLFGKIGEKGIVKSLHISQGLFNAGGCIANINYGIIAFCHNYSYVYDYPGAGGICNSNYNLVYGCRNMGVVMGDDAGGIVDWNATTLATVSQCSNYGVVEGTHLASGIANSNRGWIYNCYNKGILSDSYNRAVALCGIVYQNDDKCYVENCYSVGVYSFGDGIELALIDGICPICKEDYGKKVQNCYTIPVHRLQNKDRGEVISYEELISSDFITKIDKKSHSVLSVWRKDADGGTPITVADYSYETGQCKIQPELWIKDGDKEAELKDGKYSLKFDCYFNDSDPVVSVDNTDIAEVSNEGGVYSILLKRKGTTQVNIHFNETENNSSADYEFALKIKKSEKTSLSDCRITLEKTSFEYSGKAQKPTVVIEDGSYVLEENTDYTIKYKNNVNVGTAKVILTGIGDYMGDVTQTFEIKKAKQKLAYQSFYQKVYGDKPFQLKVKIESGGKKLTYTSSDKKVVTVNNNGKVTIKGTGYAVITVKAAKTKSYSAKSVKIGVSVAPQKQVLKLVKAEKSRKISVKWKKDSKASGYQIQYSTDKKFKKKVGKVWVKKNETTSKTLSKLKKGKNLYYVRVRSYKTAKIDGKTTKIYSDWSKVKKVTLKK